ncbi:Uncharacterised protein [Mycobacteroides abscessus subsp. abscessus]|nr:Uncharacterised protein [Mycobacteroides abscessus subsp. abscessus]
MSAAADLDGDLGRLANVLVPVGGTAKARGRDDAAVVAVFDDLECGVTGST